MTGSGANLKLIYHRRGCVPPFVGPFMDGPKVMIVNEQDASGGDELAFLFKREKVGPLVGVRTMGAVIGTGETHAVTGGWKLLVRQFGTYYLSPNEWMPENRGVEPD